MTPDISVVIPCYNAEEMGRAGRARVEAQFTHDRTAERLREIMGLTC